MDKEEFLKRYKDGERDFSGIELRDVDLSNAWLSQTIPVIGRDNRLILNKAKLINVNFNNAQLRQVDLSEADLSGSNLSNANLSNANLRDAILKNTDLKCTRLIGADLTGSNINEAINVSSPHLLLVDEYRNSNTELVTEIRALTRGLYNWHFEIDYPYDVFMWDTASRGDFTLEKFLEAVGFFVEVDPIDFFDNTFPVKEFSFIFQKIKPYIVEREYYYLKIDIECRSDNEKIIPILIGKTKIDDWVGVCPVFNMERRSIDKSGRIEDNAANKIEHRSLVSILRSLEAAEIFPEETSYYNDYVQGIVYEIAESRNNLLHNILKYSDIIRFYNDYKHLPREGGFFGEDCQEYKDNFFDRGRNIQKLSNIVKTRFKDIKIYWIGNGLIDVYIVGKIETGDWIGIRNRLMHIY